MASVARAAFGKVWKAAYFGNAVELVLSHLILVAIAATLVSGEEVLRLLFMGNGIFIRMTILAREFFVDGARKLVGEFGLVGRLLVATYARGAVNLFVLIGQHGLDGRKEACQHNCYFKQSHNNSPGRISQKTFLACATLGAATC
jgi:hypothetical protein